MTRSSQAAQPAREQQLGRWEGRAQKYLDYRRRLGFKLKTLGDEVILFGRFLDSIHHRGPLKTSLAIRWAKGAKGGRREYWAWRLGAVRLFAKHLAAEDPRHEVPESRALGRAFGRAQPHIYSRRELSDLMDAARRVKPVTQIPPYTYRAFLGLLAATGMRCGEALGLRRRHVDLDKGMVFIDKGKPGRSRAIPLHPSVSKALRLYAKHRDRFFPIPRTDAFFVNRRGRGLTYGNLTRTFRMLRGDLGWRQRPAPRVHDLRHTFACRNLIRWSRDGVDVDRKILSLTMYLGHVHVTSTYWYFTAVPELMAIAGKRLEAFVHQGDHDESTRAVADIPVAAPNLLPPAPDRGPRRLDAHRGGVP